MVITGSSLRLSALIYCEHDSILDTTLGPEVPG